MMHLIIPFIGCLAVRNSNSIPFYVFLSLPKSRFNDPNVGSSSSKSHFQAELISCLLTESAMLSTPSLPPSIPPSPVFSSPPPLFENWFSLYLHWCWYYSYEDKVDIVLWAKARRPLPASGQLKKLKFFQLNNNKTKEKKNTHTHTTTTTKKNQLVK